MVGRRHRGRSRETGLVGAARCGQQSGRMHQGRGLQEPGLGSGRFPEGPVPTLPSCSSGPFLLPASQPSLLCLFQLSESSLGILLSSPSALSRATGLSSATIPSSFLYSLAPCAFSSYYCSQLSPLSFTVPPLTLILLFLSMSIHLTLIPSLIASVLDSLPAYCVHSTHTQQHHPPLLLVPTAHFSMHCSLLCLTANVPECFSRKSDIRAQGSLMLSCLAFCFQCSVCWPSLGAAGTVGREGTGINITCSHPDIQTCNYIHWYLQLPGQGPPFFVSSHKSSIPVVDPAGWLSVAEDRRFSTLWLAQPRRRDTGMYCCALRAMGRGAGAAAGQAPRWVGLGGCGRGTAPAGPAGRSGSDGFPACPPGTGPGPLRHHSPGVPLPQLQNSTLCRELLLLLSLWPPALLPGQRQKPPITEVVAACAVLGKARWQPPATVIPREEQCLYSLHSKAGSRGASAPAARDPLVLPQGPGISPSQCIGMSSVSLWVLFLFWTPLT